MISVSQNSPSQLVNSPIRCMSLRFFYTPQKCSLLTPDLLLTPNLEDFEVRFPSHSPDPQPQHDLLYPYLQGLHSPLLSFTIHNMILATHELLSCLKLLSPSLTTLKIQVDCLYPAGYKATETVTTDVLVALTYDACYRSQPLCPKLQAITFERCLNSNGGILAEMIFSRWRPFHPGGSVQHCISPIEHFDVYFRGRGAHKKDRRILKELYKDGLSGQARFWHL